jgi:hypothetical protein
MEYGLRAGKFAVLLDGLDEIDFHVRDIYCKQIINMTYKYPDCLFLISSRPDDRFDSWNEFYVSEIQPLSKAQIILLVEKMQFDPATKANFLKQIGARLYKTHGEFLSNPLLCTMMLMTFNEFEEIPSKMYIFYARAFEALFTRHDKTKTFFKRKFYTTLAEDDFKRLFSTFCLFSYTDMKFAFNSGEVRKYIKSAIEYEQSGVSVDNFLKDLVESTSLLLKEGDNYSFIHRSFQEYFVALFLAERQTPEMDRLLERVCANYAGDAVIALLIEMNRDAFESKYFRTKIRRLRKEMDKLDQTNCSKILSLFYDVIAVRDGKEMAAIRHGKWSNILRIAQRHYDSRFAENIERSHPFHWNQLVRDAAEHISRKRMEEPDPLSRDEIYVASIPSEIVASSPVFEHLMQARDDVRKLDDGLRRASSAKKNLIVNVLRGKASL